MKTYGNLGALGCLFSVSLSAMALSVDPLDPNISINNGAFIDGTVTDDQSTFNHGITSQDLTGDFSFKDIPVANIDGVDYFLFVYDSQETGNNPGLSIKDITIAVQGQGTLWDYDQVTYGSIDLEGDTDTPLGNGADIALKIPVTIFAGLNLTGADSLTFSWQQSNHDNGFDEWVLSGDGFFGEGDIIATAPVPIPAAAWLFGSGLLALTGLTARRKRKS